MTLTQAFCKSSIRKFLICHIVVYCLFLLCIDTAKGEDKKKDGKSKIKRKRPEDPFLPEMIVFNLDHILWPFSMEMMQQPIITTSVKYQLRDRVGRLFNLFPDVPSILEDLDSHWYKIAGLSDNSDIRRVENTTSLFDIDQFFNGLEAKLCFSTVTGSIVVGDRTIRMFPEVEDTLLQLIEKGYVLAAVSLTNSTYKTMAVLNAFDLTKHFKHMEMAPGPNKLTFSHFHHRSILQRISCNRLDFYDPNCLFTKDKSSTVQ